MIFTSILRWLKWWDVIEKRWKKITNWNGFFSHFFGSFSFINQSFNSDGGFLHPFSCNKMIIIITHTHIFNFHCRRVVLLKKFLWKRQINMRENKQTWIRTNMNMKNCVCPPSHILFLNFSLQFVCSYYKLTSRSSPFFFSFFFSLPEVKSHRFLYRRVSLWYLSDFLLNHDFSVQSKKGKEEKKCSARHKDILLKLNMCIHVQHHKKVTFFKPQKNRKKTFFFPKKKKKSWKKNPFVSTKCLVCYRVWFHLRSWSVVWKILIYDLFICMRSNIIVCHPYIYTHTIHINDYHVAMHEFLETKNDM